MPEAFLTWQRYSRDTPDFAVGRIVSGGCATPLAREVVAAYHSPFPDDRHKAGARVFPMLVPTRPDDPAADANRAGWEMLSRWDKPFLTAFWTPIGSRGDRAFHKLVPGGAGREQLTLERALPAGGLRPPVHAGRRRLRRGGAAR